MADFAWGPLTTDEARMIFSDFPRPWWVAGGCALDLHLGRQTRTHADIDLAILRGDEIALPALLAGWEIRVAHEGALTPWSGDALSPPYHQFWVRPRGRAAWAFEVLLEDHDGETWQFRRDHRVTMPISRVGRISAGGIPYVAPEVALLYKAKGHEVARNAADFGAALPGSTSKRGAGCAMRSLSLTARTRGSRRCSPARLARCRSRPGRFEAGTGGILRFAQDDSTHPLRDRTSALTSRRSQALWPDRGHRIM